MDANFSLARRCAYLGIAGIVIGVVAGILGLMDPAGVYGPPAGYNFTTQMGKVNAILLAIMMLCFTAAYLGYHFAGAVGSDALGRTGTALTALGNLGVALGFLHAVFSGAPSPLIMAGYLFLPGTILLTVAAMREKQVSALYAWWPVAVMVLLTATELAIPISGWSVIVHQTIFGSIAFAVLAILGREPVGAATQPA